MEQQATTLFVAGYDGDAAFARVVHIAEALAMLHEGRLRVEVQRADDEASFDALRVAKNKEFGVLHASSPMVWLDGGMYLGGAAEATGWLRENFTSPKAHRRLVTHANDRAELGDFDYDLIVIGGGSGGLACSKEAAALGQRVAVLDYVKPSPHGSQWGLGGTCVNVGCIPKKLMHQASLLGESVADARAFGWQVAEDAKHDWEEMVGAVQDHIMGLNFKYRVQLRDQNVTYINALGSFVDPHTIRCVDAKGEESTITARRVVVAVGGRPTALGCEGGELAISSDDLFSMEKPPGRTLVIGASYVALECAGFLTALGYRTTVLVRSILLRGFDRDMAERIGEFMEGQGTLIVKGCTPRKLERLPDGRIKAYWGPSGSEEVTAEEVFDTVFAAVGRRADTHALGLDNAGLEAQRNGKLRCTDEQTSVPHIYAIGDVVDGCPELTPVAIQAGKLLARRLYSSSRQSMDYARIPTTVFTPIEYGCCGLSEDDARAQLGDDRVDVYHSQYTPLEWTLSEEREQDACYCKVVVDTQDNERVLGFHILGPNAGEITQGFGTALRLGASFADFADTIGIHPTVAEEFTTLTVTKSSGKDAAKGGC